MARNSCIYCRFSTPSKTAFSAMKKLDTFFIAENIGAFKISHKNSVADFNPSFLQKLADLLPLLASLRNGSFQQ